MPPNPNIETETVEEVSLPPLAELCLEEANTIRRLMFEKRLPQTDIFDLQDVPVSEASPEAAQQVGWQGRLFDVQDIPSFKPNRYSAKVLLINPLSIDRVYLGGDGKVIKRDFSESYAVYPEQELILGRHIKQIREYHPQAQDDDLAELRVILQDAASSLRA